MLSDSQKGATCTKTLTDALNKEDIEFLVPSYTPSLQGIIPLLTYTLVRATLLNVSKPEGFEPEFTRQITYRDFDRMFPNEEA